MGLKFDPPVKNTRRELHLDHHTFLQVQQDQMTEIETRLRAVVKPAPWWMPRWAHERLLRAILHLEWFWEVTERKGVE